MNTKNTVVLWFTGLSGSGKTTIAKSLREYLENNSKKTLVIDGDIVRETLHNSLGFSRMDIKENNRLIASMAKKQMNYYDFILIPIISPYIDDRRVAKKIIGNKYFIELFIKSSLEKCIKRDVKGLYKKAIDGDITNMIGFSDSNPYEVPLSPNLTVNTGKINLHESVDIIIKYINKRQGN